MLRMSTMTVPSYEEASWRAPVTDVESELCSLRTAVESSQRGLSQLEAKIASKLEATCKRQACSRRSRKGREPGG